MKGAKASNKVTPDMLPLSCAGIQKWGGAMADQFSSELMAAGALAKTKPRRNRSAQRRFGYTLVRASSKRT
jgi:hypothetical protein